MIEQMISIIDRVVQLLTRRAERREKLFASLLLPIFDDLLLVHSDYAQALSDACSQLRDKGTDTRTVAEMLRARRRELEPVRHKLRALCKETQPLKEGGAVVDFINAVVLYFPQGYIENYKVSDFTDILELLNAWDGESDIETPHGPIERPRACLRDHILLTIERHRLRWSHVCECYARLKVQVLT
jgi:hypothetical protein